MGLRNGLVVFAALAISALTGCTPTAPPTPTPISSSTPLGNLSLASSNAKFADTKNELHVWRDLDRVSTGVWSSAGDALQISVSVQVAGKGSVFLRAMVDDSVALPSDIQLFKAGDVTSSERSFTFVVPNVSSGFHLVRIQWLSGDSYTAKGRSLAVRSAPHDSPLPTAQLQVTSPASGPSVHIDRAATGNWSTIPGLTTKLTTQKRTSMQITFAAELGVVSKRFLARTLIDGAPAVPGDVTMEQQDRQSGGTRSVTFTAENVAAGDHSVEVQWFSDAGGDIWVGDRTLSVYAVDNTQSSPDGAISSFNQEGPPETVTATDWRTNWAGAVSTGTTAGSGVTIGVSLEHLQSAGSGDVHIRAVRADGSVMDPPEYVLDKDKSFNTQTLLFQTKDFRAPGLQFYKIEYKVDDGVTAQFRDHAIVSGAVRRTGADFAQSQPFENHLHPAQGTFEMLTICLDPQRPGEAPLTDAVVKNIVDGADGGMSMRGLYSEMSGQRWRIGKHTVLGCGTPSIYHPPAEHQGFWYWSNNAFAVMRQDAIAAAAADFDFKSHDLDGDGRVLPNELDIEICVPQTGTSGQAGQFADYPINGGTLGIASIDCYFGPASFRKGAIGTVGHENGHETLGAYDLYGPGIPPMPDNLSLMGTGGAVHMSAYEKLHHGWIAPQVLDITQWTGRPDTTGNTVPRSSSLTLTIDPIETSKRALIIYNPLRGHDEYFIVENRSMSTTLGITNYDSNLFGSGGLVLWHIVENPALLNPNIPPPVPCRPAFPSATSGCVDAALWSERLAQFGWVVGGIQNWGSILPNQVTSLVWADGAPLDMTLTGISGQRSLLKITKNTPPVSTP